ncbi:MAG TPA: YraN family protein [Candidatus Binataceae bacterium]|nr:YraN family protein [Candidatus Binataceae bacterium]
MAWHASWAGAIWARVDAFLSRLAARESVLPGTARFRFGRAGERIARRYLRRLGYRIVVQNYRAAGAEIDIVAMDGETIVFVEVKRRTGIAAGTPEEAVTPAKQEQIRRAAEVFVAYHRAADRVARFDVIAIVEDGRARRIQHLKDAF